jgi:molybdate transport system substrate-binding protein
MKKKLSFLKRLLAWTLFISIGAQPLLNPVPARAETDKVIVFAAASTTNAITDIIAAFAADAQIQVVPSFASSSTLAKQIENDAPADLYISADEKWMDYLAQRHLIKEDSRVNLLGNRIVLIAPADSKLPATEIKAGITLERWLGDGRLAMGDPAHVPAGIYGQQALDNLGLWAQVKDKLAPAKDVRAALTLVERAETPLGLVYATDAAISHKVRVIGTFPESSHPPIIYPAALVVGRNASAARQFLTFLKSAPAAAIFAKYGFSVR